MARITIEDCLNKVNNRFALIHMAAKRVRLLRKGSEPTISSKNKDIVVALREIASGTVKKQVRTEPPELQTPIESDKPLELLPEHAEEKPIENTEQEEGKEPEKEV